MDVSKDYYDILNVSSVADEEVIRAAYRTLAKKFHPDTTRPGTASSEKFREIQEAYDVLADRIARADYDSKRIKRKAANAKSEEGSKDSNRAGEGDWTVICQYYPTVALAEKHLRLISPLLAEDFRSRILSEKDFENSPELYRDIRDRHLSKLFGNNREIQRFGEWLLIEKHAEAAKELNKTMVILSGRAPPADVVSRICAKFGLIYDSNGTSDREFEVFNGVVGLSEGAMIQLRLRKVVEVDGMYHALKDGETECFSTWHDAWTWAHGSEEPSFFYIHRFAVIVIVLVVGGILAALLYQHG